MKKYKTKTGKLAVTLGCVAVLSAAGLGGCGMADAESKTESESQITETDIRDANIQETDNRETNIQETDNRDIDL